MLWHPPFSKKTLFLFVFEKSFPKRLRWFRWDFSWISNQKKSGKTRNRLQKFTLLAFEKNKNEKYWNLRIRCQIIWHIIWHQINIIWHSILEFDTESWIFDINSSIFNTNSWLFDIVKIWCQIFGDDVKYYNMMIIFQENQFVERITVLVKC